jgi:hypothetical protein
MNRGIRGCVIEEERDKGSESESGREGEGEYVSECLTCGRHTKCLSD